MTLMELLSGVCLITGYFLLHPVSKFLLPPVRVKTWPEVAFGLKWNIETLETILEELNSPEWMVRGIAIRKLGQHGQAGAVGVERLFELTFDEHASSYSLQLPQGGNPLRTYEILPE